MSLKIAYMQISNILPQDKIHKDTKSSMWEKSPDTMNFVFDPIFSSARQCQRNVRIQEQLTKSIKTIVMSKVCFSSLLLKLTSMLLLIKTNLLDIYRPKADLISPTKSLVFLKT